MGYASKAGRAYASSRSPQAQAVCDRCGIWYQHSALSFQYGWAGSSVINKQLLVCQRCTDVMNPQLRSITLPADPMPIQNPRFENFLQAESNYRVTSGPQETFSWTGIPIPSGDIIVDSPDGVDKRVTQQTGFATGSRNNRPGTDPNAPGNDDPGLPRETIEIPIAWNYDSSDPPLVIIIGGITYYLLFSVTGEYEVSRNGRPLYGRA